MQKIAIDIGFGSTKSYTNKQISKLPSAVSHAGRALFEHSEKIYNFNGLAYHVGQEAVRDAYATRDYSFLEKFAPLLAYKAIIDADLDLSKPIKLATGLSLLNWDKKEQFAKSLEDFTVNNTRINNLELYIYPQGKGIFVDVMKIHPEIKDGLTLIVDIGYNTLDVIPFENGKPLAKDAWANTFGVNVMVSELDKYLASNFGLSLNEAEVNEIFQKRIVTAGTKKDLSFIIDEEKNKYTAQVFQILKSKNSNLFNKADHIIIAGGGAYTFSNYNFEDKNIIFPKGEYEYSNVRGYYESLNDA